MSTIAACLVLIVLAIYAVHQLLEYSRNREKRDATARRTVEVKRLMHGTGSLVADPPEAGMLVLHLTAGDTPSRVQLGAMAWVAREMMGSDTPDGLVQRGRWLARQVKDPVAAVDEACRILTVALTVAEQARFAEAVTEIATAEGRPDGNRAGLMRRFVESLDLRGRYA